MIEFFRRASSSIVARIFFGLLAISFAFMWGGQDGLRMMGASKESTVAKVGKISISNRDLAVAVERARLDMRLRTGQDISVEDIKKMGVERQLLEKLVNEALLKLEAERLNISVSDAFMVKMLHRQKVFQRPNGSFSKEIFMRFIQNFGFRTEKDYIDYLKAEVLRSRLLSALSANVSLPAGATDPLFAWNAQVRTVEGVSVDPTKLQIKEQATENQLRDFYGKNRRNFFAPERRTFKALVLDAATVKTSIKSGDVQVIYDLEKDTKYKGIEVSKAKKIIKEQLQREAAQEIMIAQADKIQTAFEAGASLADVAKENSITLKEFVDAPLGDLAAKRSTLEQGIIDIAFSAEEAELSPLENIAGTQKYISVYLENSKEPAQLSFSAAMAEVKKAYNRDQQALLTKELVDQIQKQLDGGSSLRDVAQKHKLTFVKLKADRQKALSPTAINLPAAAINQLFVVPVGRPTLLPYQSKAGEPLFLVAKVTGIQNSGKVKDKKERDLFEQRLAQQSGRDMFESYVAYLKTQNTVDINKKYFEK